MAEPCVAGLPHPTLFAACQHDSYPKAAVKSQPWKNFAGLALDRQFLNGERDSRSSLVVACPKNYAWGSSSNGGSW